MKNADIIAMVALIVSGLGGVIAIIQWRRSIGVRRAEFVATIVQKLRFEPEMVETMYKIEYGQEHWYDNFHRSGELERKVDALFAYLTYIYYLRKSGNLSKKEFALFEFKLVSVCKQSDSQKYLKTLYDVSNDYGVDSSFEPLIAYLKKKIPEDERIVQF